MISRQLWAALLCLLGTSLVCAAPEGSPPNASARFGLEIRAGLPLDEALQALARGTGVQLVFFSQITAGRIAPALAGEYTVAAALARVLDGSGLIFRQVNERTYQVQPGPPSAAGSQGRSRGANGTRRSTAAPVSADMEEVHVIATVEQLVATRIPTPLHEIPQTMSVISAEQIRQQNSVDLGDVLRNAPGIATRRTTSMDEQAYSRSFVVDSYHVDGAGALKPRLLNGATLYQGTPDLSEFDHVEVLRGSDALFTGNSNPGGTVSLVRKRPLSTAAVALNATLGSWNNRRVELDVTGPLTDDGSLRARADAVYLNRDYFFDRAHLERKKVFAAVEYDFTPAATLTAGGTYQWDDSLPLESGLPLFWDGSDPHLPRNTALTFDWAFYNTRQSGAYLRYQQLFADDWRFQLNASASRETVAYNYGMFTGAINPANLTLSAPLAAIMRRPDRFTVNQADMTLTGVLDWFGLREEIALGADFTRSRARLAYDLFTAFGPPLVDIRTFDPAAYPNPRGTRVPDIGLDATIELEQYGAFVSLRVDLNRAWSVTGGARLATDTHRLAGTVWFGSIVLPGLTNELGSRNVITPYAALMYRINDHISWYASYADIYLSQNGDYTSANGAAIGPQHGVNIESGLKGVWRGGALNASLAVYRIAEQHVAIQDEVAGCCYTSGTGYSRGAEIEVDGELAAGWLIGSGYTYNLKETADGSIPSTSTPKHLLKIWTSVTLPGALSQWTVGGNLRAQTAARGNLLFQCSLQSQICTPSEVVGQRAYAVLDLRAGFEGGPNWQVALSLNNVLDKRYYLSQNTPDLNVWYGEPRNLMLRIDAKY